MENFPRLFGKEFLPDPNILLNNYDVFMNDPNLNTYLNGTSPKYNPNPNINLRYLFGQDYKLDENYIVAPEPEKQIQIEITIFDKNHWIYPSNQENIITDIPSETVIKVTDSLKGIRKYQDMLDKKLHKDLHADELELYVSKNTFKFSANLKTTIKDNYISPTPVDPALEITKLFKDIFKLNIDVSKSLIIDKNNYNPTFTVDFGGVKLDTDTYNISGAEQLYIPNIYKQTIEDSITIIKNNNPTKTEDELLPLYQTKTEQILEPLYKNIFYGIKIIPDTTKRSVLYKDLGPTEMLLFTKENIKIFDSKENPLLKLVKFHRPDAWNLAFTYLDTEFLNLQDSSKKLENQTIIKTEKKLLVYGGTTTTDTEPLNQQLTFDIATEKNTLGLNVLSNRVDSTNNLKILNGSILQTKINTVPYVFVIGGIDKNKLSTNYNLKHIISYSKISNDVPGNFIQIDSSNLDSSTDIIKTLDLDSSNCFFIELNKIIFAVIIKKSENGNFTYLYKVDVKLENDKPSLNFQLKNVVPSYFDKPLFIKSSISDKILMMDNVCSFQNTEAAGVVSKPTVYSIKAIELKCQDIQTEQLTLTNKEFQINDSEKVLNIPTEIFNQREKTLVETKMVSNVSTSYYNCKIDLGSYIIEDNTNIKLNKKTFLLNHGIWNINTNELWNDTLVKVFNPLTQLDYINYNISSQQKNFYMNLHRGKYQELETVSSILLLNPIIGTSMFSGAIQLNKLFTSTELFGKPLLNTKTLVSSDLNKAAYYTRQEEVLYQSLLVRQVQNLEAYNESIKFYDIEAPNNYNEDKYITLTPVTKAVALTEDDKRYFDYLMNLCFETNLDKYNDYNYLANVSNYLEGTNKIKFIIPEFFFDIIFNRKMYNINKKVLEWYWDNYTFKDNKFTVQKEALTFNGKKFSKNHIQIILRNFYKNTFDETKQTSTGKSSTTRYSPNISNIIKVSGNFVSEMNYPTFNFLKPLIQDPESDKTLTKYKYMIIPNNNGSITADLYRISDNTYSNTKNFQEADNLISSSLTPIYKQGNSRIIKKYSLEDVNLQTDSYFLSQFKYFVAPPKKGGNDGNPGTSVNFPKESCSNIPAGSKVLFLPGTYTKRLNTNDGYLSTMACLIGAAGLNIYGLGEETIIDSAQNVSLSSRDAPITGNFTSTVNISNYPNNSTINYGSAIASSNLKINIRNCSFKYNARRSTNYMCSLFRYLSTASINQIHNCTFKITGTYSLNYNNDGGTINYSNCKFEGGTRIGNYSGSHSFNLIANDNIDNLINNTTTRDKLNVFNPEKINFIPTYTLIPLLSTGFYNKDDNDLKNLTLEDKKEINLPVFTDTRAMNTLTNFKITL